MDPGQWIGWGLREFTSRCPKRMDLRERAMSDGWIRGDAFVYCMGSCGKGPRKKRDLCQREASVYSGPVRLCGADCSEGKKKTSLLSKECELIVLEDLKL